VIGSAKLLFGRLDRVELRDAWLSEVTDFTPWMAQHEDRPPAIGPRTSVR
jgi:hypothetical protein